jgi:hypothetical protein
MARSGNPSGRRTCRIPPREHRAPVRVTAAVAATLGEITFMGSVIKKRRKRMAKKKHRKLLRKTRVARRKAGK